MARIFRMILLTMILMMVALVSALITMRFAIHGREVAVPRLVGLTPVAAGDLASSNGLRLVIEERFYSSQIPEGHIVSQLPAAGARVRRGWVVRVSESLGPQRSMVPDVIGQSQRAAQINLERRGLEVGTVAQGSIPGFPADQVIAQSPPPNASAASPKVGILVNLQDVARAYVMPDFVGRRLADAARVIQAAGLHLATAAPGPEAEADAIKRAESGALAEDVIVRQFPAPGQKVTADTAIRFELMKVEAPKEAPK